MDCRFFAFRCLGLEFSKKKQPQSLSWNYFSTTKRKEDKPKFKICDQKNWGGGHKTCILSTPILIVMVHCTYCRPVHAVIDDTLYMYVSIANLHTCIVIHWYAINLRKISGLH